MNKRDDLWMTSCSFLICCNLFFFLFYCFLNSLQPTSVSLPCFLFFFFLHLRHLSLVPSHTGRISVSQHCMDVTAVASDAEVFIFCCREVTAQCGGKLVDSCLSYRISMIRMFFFCQITYFTTCLSWKLQSAALNVMHSLTHYNKDVPPPLSFLLSLVCSFVGQLYLQVEI